MSRHGINGVYPVVLMVAIMVGNEVMPTVAVIGPVEVVEDEVSGEMEAGPPEWVRDPCVHVIIIPGRRIVSDDGRPFIIVVVINDVGI